MSREDDYDARERELWGDPEMISEALSEAPVLVWRGVRSGGAPGTPSHWSHPAVRTGAVALAALRDADCAEFGRLVLADVKRILRERAVDEVDNEWDDYGYGRRGAA